MTNGRELQTVLFAENGADQKYIHNVTFISGKVISLLQNNLFSVNKLVKYCIFKLEIHQSL